MISFYFYLCSVVEIKSYRLGMTQGQVNDDRMITTHLGRCGAVMLCSLLNISKKDSLKWMLMTVRWFLPRCCCLHSLASGLISLGEISDVLWVWLEFNGGVGLVYGGLPRPNLMGVWGPRVRGEQAPRGSARPADRGPFSMDRPEEMDARGGPHSSASGLLLFLASLLPSALLLSHDQHPSLCCASLSPPFSPESFIAQRMLFHFSGDWVIEVRLLRSYFVKKFTSCHPVRI